MDARACARRAAFLGGSPSPFAGRAKETEQKPHREKETPDGEQFTLTIFFSGRRIQGHPLLPTNRALHVGVEFLHEFVCDFIEFGVFQIVAAAQRQEANVKKKKCNRYFFMVGMVYKLNKDSSPSKRSKRAVGALRKRCLCTVQDAIPLSERTSLHFFNIVKAPIVYFCIMRNSIDSYH